MCKDVSKIDRTKLFPVVHGERPRDNRYKWDQERLGLDIKENSQVPRGQSISGTGCPGRKLSLHLWEFSRSGWIKP